MYLISDDSVSKTDIESFFDGIINEFIHDDGESGALDTLLIAFTPTLTKIHKDIANSNLFTLIVHTLFYWIYSLPEVSWLQFF